MSNSDVSASSTARVLVMVEQPLIVEVIKLTLNHGVYSTRAIATTGGRIRSVDAQRTQGLGIERHAALSSCNCWCTFETPED